MDTLINRVVKRLQYEVNSYLLTRRNYRFLAKLKSYGKNVSIKQPVKPQRLAPALFSFFHTQGAWQQ